MNIKLKTGSGSWRGTWGLISASLAITVIITITTTLFLIALHAAAVEGDGLIDTVSGSAESLIYFKDIKKGLKPLLKSDFYDDAEGLSLFKGPIKADMSAPAITFLGDIEKSLGFSVTPRRVLYLLGKNAVIYKTPAAGGKGVVGKAVGGKGAGGKEVGGKATVAIIEVGWFKKFLIKTISSLKGSIAEEDINGLSVSSVNSGNRKFYYTIVANYAIFSDSSLALKTQHDALIGVNSDTFLNNPDFKKSISTIPSGYHILMFHKITEPEPYETGLIKRGERLVREVDSIFTTITFTKYGADISLYAPLKTGNTEKVLAGLSDVNKKLAPEIESLPSETAGFIAFNAYDPTILYTNFFKNWFSGIFERVNYVSILHKWKVEAGFDIEGGIVNNLAGGAILAVTGIGYEGRKPYIKGFSCFGVKDGGIPVITENLTALFDYAFWEDGPSLYEYNGAGLHYMGILREETVDWNGSRYLRTREANPGFGFKGNRLYFYRDISTIERLLNASILNRIDVASGKRSFDGDSLVKSNPYIDAQKDLPIGEHDLYLYLSGENTTNTIEKYLINLNAHYRYFLYEDAEKRLVPFLELIRESFVSFYGGINFEGDAIKGSFRLVTEDLD